MRPLAAALLALSCLACSHEADPKFKEPMKLGGHEVSAQTLNDGHVAYLQYCRACHGDKGDGKGPAAPGLRPPPRAKMTVISWLGIFPLVYIYAELFNWILPPSTPVILKVLAVTALVVPTMSYVVAPRLTRLFKNWLYPGPV